MKKIAYSAILSLVLLPAAVFALTDNTTAPLQIAPEFHYHLEAADWDSAIVAGTDGICIGYYTGPGFNNWVQVFKQATTSAGDFDVDIDMTGITFTAIQGGDYYSAGDDCTTYGGETYLVVDSGSGGAGGFINLEFIGSTGAGSSTTIYATSSTETITNNPTLDFFLGFLIFFICMIFPIWLFRRK